MTPVSYRNNNPGNIRVSSITWLGTVPRARMTPEQASDARFVVFETPVYGFRAMSILLRNYGPLHEAHTVRALIEKWAPENENPTDAYVKDVAHDCQVGPDDIIDQSRRPVMFLLAKAIAKHEAGSWEPWWNEADLNAGLDMAGFVNRTVPVS